MITSYTLQLDCCCSITFVGQSCLLNGFLKNLLVQPCYLHLIWGIQIFFVTGSSITANVIVKAGLFFEKYSVKL